MPADPTPASAHVVDVDDPRVREAILAIGADDIDGWRVFEDWEADLILAALRALGGAK